MAKTPVKKTTAKPARRTVGKSVKSSLGPVPKGKSVKKKTTPFKKTGVKKTTKKKPVSDKERELRAANLIANTENKKKLVSKRPKKNLHAKTDFRSVGRGG